MKGCRKVGAKIVSSHNEQTPYTTKNGDQKNPESGGTKAKRVMTRHLEEAAEWRTMLTRPGRNSSRDVGNVSDDPQTNTRGKEDSTADCETNILSRC